jgi:ubiquinone/menaquinone biosynthesis C-methylase UbiE
MAKIADLWEHHDWSSAEYVNRWAEGQDPKEAQREEPFRLMTEVIPYAKDAPIAILDLGSGYGALCHFLLGHYSNARAVCHDGSDEMIKLGQNRMAEFKNRVSHVQADFSHQGWSKKVDGRFEAIVSSIAIHNVRAYETIQSIYAEAFLLLKPGGCFLNFDRMRPSLEEQLNWLREVGFENVQCFWDSPKRALIGGFKKKN